MSDTLNHECGIAMVRLLKPIEHFVDKYETPFYGLKRMHLMMKKMKNRGQDGAGLATLKLDMRPGNQYLYRSRSAADTPIKDVFGQIGQKFKALAADFSEQPEEFKRLSQDPAWLKRNVPHLGELHLGHLRYGTHGKNEVSLCHPLLRPNNWMARNLVMAGNFNLTNVHQIFNELVELGQHPKAKSDTVTILEKIGHFLDAEVEHVFNNFKDQGYSHKQITDTLAKELDIANVLRRATKQFDGGYVLCGMIGHGNAFVMRDPAGIRPAFYYKNDEVVVVASERPAIQMAFDAPFEDIQEVKPGHVLIMKKDGRVSEERVQKSTVIAPCSFERIYFSKGSDKEIYQERKMLGRLLTDKVLEACDYDLENTVFSYIPNTSEVSFLGLVQGLDDYLNEQKEAALEDKNLSIAEKKAILRKKPRVEKIVDKDEKMRTFIAGDSGRDNMVSGAYNLTYGCVKEQDTLVLVDDSIVRGTTLEKNILRNVAQLKPKKIVIVSSAPQIRYPDCYGIDMAKINDLVAFKAVLALLKDHEMEFLLKEIEVKCKTQQEQQVDKPVNLVKEIYDKFTADEITNKIAEIITPENFEPEVQVVYQSISNLHKACPNNKGDWYFSGNYPTKGGMGVVNKAFLNYRSGKNIRAYENA